MKYPEEFIIQTVKQFEAGTSIKGLSRSLKIASSTLYRWVEACKTIPRKKGEYTPAGYQRLLDHAKKLERPLEVIHLSGCIDLIPPHQRLFVLEDIHENHPEYSGYELCETLKVPRIFFATFKKEDAYRRNYTSERSFIDGVSNYIEFFNNERQHETLNYHTPAEFEKSSDCDFSK
mgnify:CR=1 FL=1